MFIEPYPPPFEDRAVAFLDILGFTDLIASTEQHPSKLTSLFGLRAILDNHVKWDNASLASSVPDEMKPKYIFISDSVILSAPRQCEGYSGLVAVAVKSIQISMKLLEAGYLVRGGISTGPVWHDDRNIFGRGYIVAYKSETKANHPRIVLSNKAKEVLESDCHLEIPLSDLGLFLRHEGELILDTLNPQYLRGAEVGGRIEDAFKQYRGFILAQLEILDADSSARKKWEWFARFFDDALTRHQVDTVHPVHPVR